MTNQHKRCLDVGPLQKRVQLIDKLMKCARVGAKLTPSVARTVVRADSREFRDLRLDQAPLNGEVTAAGFEYDSWLRALCSAGAVKVKTPPANVNQPSGRRKGRRG